MLNYHYRKVSRLFLILLCCGTITACGQAGDLYIPEQQTASMTIAATTLP